MMQEERMESWIREQDIESDISSMVRKSSKLTFVIQIATHALNFPEKREKK